MTAGSIAWDGMSGVEVETERNFSEALIENSVTRFCRHSEQLTLFTLRAPTPTPVHSWPNRVVRGQSGRGVRVRALPSIESMVAEIGSIAAVALSGRPALGHIVALNVVNCLPDGVSSRMGCHAMSPLSVPDGGHLDERAFLRRTCEGLAMPSVR